MNWPFIKRKKYDELEKKIEDFSKKIDALDDLVNKLNESLEFKEEIIETISTNFSELKEAVNEWRDGDGNIRDAEGFWLLQEGVDKILQRFDFYYTSDKEQYPKINLNLKFTKKNFYKLANEKSDKLIKNINDRHEQ
jgi:chromosome segregation ATPase